MEKNYDIIVLGAGIKEYILLGLLLKFPKIKKEMLNQEEIKIYQINKGKYFGEESPSLNLTQLYSHFNKNQNFLDKLDEDKDWNIDLIPKIIMTNSPLVKILLITYVYQFIEWKNIEEAFVYQYDKGGMFSSPKGKIYKVPSSIDDINNSDLMGMFEKGRCKKFYNFIQNLKNEDINNNKIEINISFKDLIDQYGLEINTIDFIGHAIALYSDNNFIEDKAINAIKNIKFYFSCFEPKSKNQFYTSPYIYPIWGLQKIYKNYDRQISLFDSKYIKDCNVDEILYDENNKFKGIKTTKGEYIYGSILISEPTYMVKFNKVQAKNKIIRRICLLNHPIPDIGEFDSCQIIIPQSQTGKKNDIYILQLGYGHCICKKGYYVVIISTFDDNSEINKQLAPAMDIIGNIIDFFDKKYIYYEPIDKSFKDDIFISNSFLPQSHFEHDFNDIIEEFYKITGAKLQFETSEKEEQYNHNFDK